MLAPSVSDHLMNQHNSGSSLTVTGGSPSIMILMPPSDSSGNRHDLCFTMNGLWGWPSKHLSIADEPCRRGELSRRMPLASLSINSVPQKIKSNAGAALLAASMLGQSGTASQQHSHLQLWLQEQLTKLPFAGSVAKHLAETSTTASASSTQAAASVLPAQPGPRLRTKPRGLKAEDLPLWDLFSELDINGDGGIDVDELKLAMDKLGLPGFPHSLAKSLVSHCVVGKTSGKCSTGKVSWDQFRHHVYERDKQMAAAFEGFDRDSEGNIKAQDLAGAFMAAGVPVTGRVIRKVMEAVGKEGHDTISYPEFRRIVCLMPGWKASGDGIRTYGTWIQMDPSPRKTVRSDSKPMVTQAHQEDSVKQYFMFDMLLRASMVGALAVATLMAINSD